ncbi:MAG TPA: MoaD/ThiS family protein [Gemmatimonadaceae bacterium]|nr:MoaD/ThiS family protein [Gemmatimonadaceae bacterium]
MPNGVGPFVFPLRYSTGTILNYPTAKPMTVTVLLFASYADRLGTNQLSLDLLSGATVSDVLGRVQSMPGADRLPLQPLVAVNERYAKRDQVLAAGDEIAIIPPVAGG